MKADLCPDRDLLASFLLGRVWEAAAGGLDAHLAECESCLRAAHELRAEDEFTLAMRAGRPELQGEPGEIAALIERAKRLRTELETVDSAETLGPAGSGKPGPDESLSFLAPPEEPDEIGRLGPYHVLEVLGVGGMGIVFRARDPILQRLVALKVMRPSIAARGSSKNRFLREARATATIEHDHIVTIHQVGEDRDVPFIAMQFLRGESLHTRLRREQRLDQREALRIGREVAQGLTAAHVHGVIHRDIKPDNIWLEAGTRRVKILDFGLVRTEDVSELTQSGVVVGTPRYMAPEQAMGLPIDARTDLFSLGSVLYHLLAGKPPFGGHVLTATLIAVVRAEPPPVDSLRPEVDPEVSRLVHQLLCKEPEQRPRSAAEVSQAIAAIEQRLQTGAPPPAKPTGAKASLSRGLLCIAGGLVALLLTLLLSLFAATIQNRPPVDRGSAAAKSAANSHVPAEHPHRTAAADAARKADRAAAEWVLALGGEVAINTATRRGVFVRPPAELPDEPFSVTWISLKGNRRLKNDDLQTIKGLQSLQMLHLDDTSIGDAGMGHLIDLPQLGYLNLVATQVTDEGLRALAGLPELTQLYLSRCAITDDGLPFLYQMRLTDLTLDGTEISFDGLNQLAGNTTLRRLNVVHLGLRKEQVAQLSHLLPNCQIQSEHGPVDP
jgi:serine/threonine protein kinase